VNPTDSLGAGEDSQERVPASFVALYLAPGGQRLRMARAQLLQRHELCEDMAQLLTERAGAQRAVLGVTEADVLQRIGQGLADAGQVFSAEEAAWVLQRLAELLDWPFPGGQPPAG
jgi:hypothetical protein